MSRAFTKEPDGSEPIQLTERQISPERNFVTESGLKQIEAEIEKLHEQLNSTESKTDELIKAQAQRDLRYWQARRNSAELIIPNDASGKVSFGRLVTVENNNGQKTFRIVGQDEADPLKNLLSYTSPLAQSLIGKELGDEVSIGGKTAEIIAII